MAEPPLLPPFPRNEDGTMSAAQLLMGAIDVYQVAGQIRLQLLALIAAEKARETAGGEK